MPAHSTSKQVLPPPRPPPPREIFHLPPRPHAPRTGRYWIRRALIGAPEEALERIELLVSELVTNSVTHADLSPDQNVALQVVRLPGRVRVEVADPGVPFEPRRSPEPDGRSKWGLFLLSRMADRWGMDRLKRGKAIWFEVDL